MAVKTENPVVPSKEKLGIDLDRILTEEVGYGKYQLKAIALCGLAAIFIGYASASYIFTAARTNTRCAIPECEANDSQDFSPPWIFNAVPPHGDTFVNCHRFAPLTAQNITTSSCQPDLFDRNTVIKCTNYVYEHNNSAVYEFDLACDEWRWYFIGASQVLGTIISLPVTGFVADRWGRRIALSVNCFNYAWINTILYWSNSYTTFLLGGFFGKLSGGSAFTCSYILLLEYVRPKHRMTVMSIINTCFSVGSIMQGSVAWMVPNWRLLILSIFGPMLISVTYFWVMPETVRWLISKNRLEESRNILKRAAEMNGNYITSLAMYLLGNFCISLVKVVNYTYTSELFPTRYRSSLVTYSSMFARIGEITAPMTPALAAQVWEHLPFVLFAGMALVSGLLILLVPETLGSTLPETMEDANNLGRDQPSTVRYLRRVMSRRRCYSLR